MYTIARNALTDHHRYRERFQIVNNDLPEETADEAESPDIRIQSKRINDALGKLPKQDRELLSLATGGLPYKEIAALLDISEANVKVRVHRIRLRLRTILNDEVE